MRIRESSSPPARLGIIFFVGLSNQKEATFGESPFWSFEPEKLENEDSRTNPTLVALPLSTSKWAKYGDLTRNCGSYRNGPKTWFQPRSRNYLPIARIS